VTIAAEDQGIISFSLDDTDTFALVNCINFSMLKTFEVGIYLQLYFEH